jgi:hypothetical protein
MRTTLDIDADILKAAKVVAEAERKTLGQVLSELVRKGLAGSAGGPSSETGRARGLEGGCSVGSPRGTAKRRRPIGR